MLLGVILCLMAVSSCSEEEPNEVPVVPVVPSLPVDSIPSNKPDSIPSNKPDSIPNDNPGTGINTDINDWDIDNYDNGGYAI